MNVLVIVTRCLLAAVGCCCSGEDKDQSQCNQAVLSHPGIGEFLRRGRDSLFYLLPGCSILGAAVITSILSGSGYLGGIIAAILGPGIFCVLLILVLVFGRVLLLLPPERL